MEKDKTNDASSYDVNRYDVPEEETTILFPNAAIKSEEDDCIDNEDNDFIPTRFCYNNEHNVTPDKPSAYAKGIVVPISGEGEKSFIVTKVTKKKSKTAKQKKVNALLHSLITNCVVNDTPLCSVTARNLKTSDMLFMELKEVEDDEEEPLYNTFGYNPKLQLKKSCNDLEGPYKKNCACDDCEYIDICDEFRFGSYCVAAVERYYKENKYSATEKDAYIVYTSHYNRALDFHSFNPNCNRKGMRSTEVTRPPHCMQEGSLKHVLHWVKWNKECGPEKAFYQEIRIRKKRAKVMKKAKEMSKNSYRYVRHNDSN